MQTAGLPRSFLQLDIGATSGHVGRHSDAAWFTRSAHDLSFMRILPGIEYDVPHATRGQFARDTFGCFNASGWPLVVSCGNHRRQSLMVVAPCGHELEAVS
jgi:hypothetical protein